MMTLKQRIDAFSEVGMFIHRHYSGAFKPDEAMLHEGLNKVVDAAGLYNNWFIPKFVNEAVFNLYLFLNKPDLESFSKPFSDSGNKTIAIVCAGNIPLVCFHDVLCVLLSGNKALLKLSSDDNILLPFFLKLLCHYQPAFESQILFAENKLSDFDAIIATGSDNTTSYLHYYFGKYPNIIRKSRTSIAILTGHETREDLTNLGKDVFTYFGLGCRNVSKLMVPEGYKFDAFFESIIGFGDVVNNKKYGNNYDYHRAIYLLERMPFLDNNFLMIKESVDLFSPVGVLYFQYYKTEAEVGAYLSNHKEQLQCVVGNGHTPFGYSQRPVITEFADNINTVDFLVNL